MRDEYQSRDRCHSEKAQQCPKNAVPVIFTSPSATRETFYVTILLFLLFQYITTSLVKFSPLGKTWLWRNLQKHLFGRVICREPNPGDGKIDSYRRTDRFGQGSLILRFYSCPKSPFLWSWKRTCSWAFLFPQHMSMPQESQSTAGHPSQTCLPSFLGDPMDFRSPDWRKKIWNNCVTGASSLVQKQRCLPYFGLFKVCKEIFPAITSWVSREKGRAITFYNGEK